MAFQARTSDKFPDQGEGLPSDFCSYEASRHPHNLNFFHPSFTPSMTWRQAWDCLPPALPNWSLRPVIGSFAVCMAISNFFHQYHTGHELLRCIHRLAARDLTLCGSTIAPGSCLMNLNTTSVMLPLSWPTAANIHPLAVDSSEPMSATSIPTKPSASPSAT